MLDTQVVRNNAGQKSQLKHDRSQTELYRFAYQPWNSLILGGSRPKPVRVTRRKWVASSAHKPIIWAFRPLERADLLDADEHAVLGRLVGEAGAVALATIVQPWAR